MNSIFKYIQNMNRSIHNVSLLITEGPYEGQRALWTNEGFIYQTAPLPLWSEISSKLQNISGPTLLQFENHRIFCETLGSTPHLIICGCGHVSMAIIALGKMLGFHVTAIDDRPSFCDHARKNLADEVICNNFEDALKSIPDDANNYFVIVTRGHRYDMSCLSILLNKPHTYIGMMGSKVRIRNLKQSMINEGYDQALLDQVHMPIGLAIKAETPEEIAVSILSEIIQIKNETYATYHYSKEMLLALTNEQPDCPYALTTILQRRGSAPRNAGTKMLVFENGQTISQ